MTVDGRLVKAPETSCQQQFDELAAQIIAGSCPERQELEWLATFLMLESNLSGDFDDIVYDPDLLAELCFSDDYLINTANVEDSDNLSDQDRVIYARRLLSSLGDEGLDTYSMLDPCVFEFTLEATDRSHVTIIIGFCSLGGHGVMEYDFLTGYQSGDFYEELERVGYWTADRLASVPDEWILEKWN